MADIDLTTAGKVNVASLTVTQHTFVANSAITAGAPCYLLAATGKVAHSDANGAAPINTVWGIATKTVAAGEAVTLVRRGPMDGWDFTNVAYGEGVFVSDTVGRLADTVSGTTALPVGHVIPVFGTNLGTAADKILYVECVSIAATT